MKVADVVAAVDAIAPFRSAQAWDNVGFLVGRLDADVQAVLVAVDPCAATIDEAKAQAAQVLLTHQPAFTGPIKSITDATPAGRRIQRLLAAGLSHVAVHTNLDAARGGVVEALAAAVGLADTRPLDPAPEDEAKVVVFAPERDVPAVQQAAFAAGAGVIGAYAECSFRTPGTGTFRGGDATRPAVGRPGRREEVAESRLEFVAPRARLGGILSAIRAVHSYEEPAIDVYPLLGSRAVGMARVGDLHTPIPARVLADRLRTALMCPGVVTAGDLDRSVRRVLVASDRAGDRVDPMTTSRRSLAAAAAGAECLVTGEIDHRQALEAVEAGIVVLAAGDFAAVRAVLPSLAERLRRALPGVRVEVSRAERSPLAWYAG